MGSYGRTNQEIQMNNVYSTGNLMHHGGFAGAVLAHANNINISKIFSDIKFENKITETNSQI